MPPILVLLPGMDGTGELFAPLLLALPRDIRTIVVRYPDRPLNYAGLREFIDAILPVDSPYVLLGESFSGPLAVSIASEHRSGLCGCILVASFLRCPSSVLRRFPDLCAVFVPGLVPAWVLRSRLLGKHSTPDLEQALQRALAQVSDATMRYRLRALAQVDVSSRLAQVRIPCLYLQATDDRLVSPVHGQELAGTGTDVRLESFRAPHLLLQTAPARAAEVIAQFLRRAGVAQHARAHSGTSE